MRHWFGGLTGKHFLLLFLFTFLLFFLQSSVNLSETLDIVEGQALHQYEMLIDQTNQYLNLYLNNIRNMLFHVALQPTLFLDLPEDEAVGLLHRIERSNAEIVSNIYVVDDGSRYISSRQIEMTIFPKEYATINALISGSEQGIKWSEPFMSPVAGWTVNFSYGFEGGYVVIEINLEILAGKLLDIIREPGVALIITSDRDNTILLDVGNPLIPTQKSGYPADLEGDFKEMLATSILSINRLLWSGNPLTVLRSHNNNLGWNIYLLIDPSIFEDELRPIRRTILRISIVLFVGLLLMSVLLSYYFTRPILKLVQRMDRVNSLEELEPIEEKYNDELGSLVSSYNAMMDRIEGLTSEKTSMELQMLQYQIGPHFLYNTLSSIGTLARQGRTDELRETIRSLVSLLKFTFDRSGGLVPVRDEIEILRDFMHIQKIRYGNKYTLTITMPEAAEKVIIPSLILQPIVENALFHGLVPGGVGGTIRVLLGIRQNRLSIVVKDDGIGMSERQLLTVQSYLEGDIIDEGGKIIVTAATSRSGLTGLGIKNVHDRIRIQYGKPFGLTIVSEINQGTTVTIAMPAYRPSEESPEES
jgi:two-component system, sensor histidine kinase YesM